MSNKREIRFRVWDAISKKIHPYSIVKNNALVEFELDHYSLMQYTGLKDKNGVEIYEGDVVTFDRGVGNWTGNR